MGTKQLPLPGEIVKKSNVLCRARWSVDSLWEPRLVALVASKVKQSDKDFDTYQIPITELMPPGSRGGSDYKEVSGIIDNLMGRVLHIENEEQSPYKWRKYALFSFCGYREKEGLIEVRFDKDLKPHFLELKKNFTEYGLFEYMLLPSIYSQRIFELLKSWDDKPEVTMNLGDLHKVLEVPESIRKKYPDFRRRVLEKAHKDITARTSLDYTWEPITKGKAVVAIRFIFCRAENKLPRMKSLALRRAERYQSQKNNALAKSVIICMQDHGVEESKEVQECSDERPRTNKCKLCLRWRSPSLF